MRLSRMPKKKPYVPPDVQVLIPYTTLQELLGAAHAAADFEKELEVRDQQIAALRGQLGEIFDVIGQIRTELRSYHD